MPENTSPALVAARAAHKRGFVPIPLLTRDKRPAIPAWQHTDWKAIAEQTSTTVAKALQVAFSKPEAQNVGLLLGEPSGGLVDVDLDHPATRALRDELLPPTGMHTGRDGAPRSHYWYLTEPGTLQPTRQHKMPDGSMCVEYRSTGAQSVIPPSIHPSGEHYLWWEEEPFGTGPAVVNGRALAVQVALLALGTVLVEYWPKRGGRHEAYLALAGGLLRNGDEIYPYWETNAPVLIRALAKATRDEDGPDARVSEVMGSTLRRLREGKQTTGFVKLAEIIGEKAVAQVRWLLGEVESAAGLLPRSAQRVDEPYRPPTTPPPSDGEEPLPDSEDPLDRRGQADGYSWKSIDPEPYLTGQLVPQPTTVMQRSDGAFLMYPGRINMLYGSSESAKSWLALFIVGQELERGARALYCDFEDDPVNTFGRLRLLDIPDDPIRFGFRYVRPEEPIADMQRGRGGGQPTNKGVSAKEVFAQELADYDPTLIVLDGLSVLYGLHGLDTDKTTDTDIITSWLKTLTRNGRTTVIVIDHTGKTPEKGSLPIGSQHKVSMVQGTLLQAWVKRQPMPGAVGEIELYVLKDRPGQVRAISASAGGSGKAQKAANVRIDSESTAGRTIITLSPPAGKPVSGTIIVDPEVAKSAARAADKALEEIHWEKRVRSLFRGDLDLRYTLNEIRSLLPDGTASGAKVKAALGRLLGDNMLQKVDGEGNPRPTGTRGIRYALSVGDPDYADVEGEDFAILDD